jgi:hypothetical protein
MRPTHRTAAHASGSCAGTHEHQPSSGCKRRGHRKLDGEPKHHRDDHQPRSCHCEAPGLAPHSGPAVIPPQALEELILWASDRRAHARHAATAPGTARSVHGPATASCAPTPIRASATRPIDKQAGGDEQLARSRNKRLPVPRHAQEDACYDQRDPDPVQDSVTGTAAVAASAHALRETTSRHAPAAPYLTLAVPDADNELLSYPSRLRRSTNRRARAAPNAAVCRGRAVLTSLLVPPTVIAAAPCRSTSNLYQPGGSHEAFACAA